MRIIVQNPKTGCYLEDTGGWTRDVRLARDFLSSSDAINVRRQQQLPQASLVFRFEREGYSITVPLEPLHSDTPQIPMRPESAPTHDAGLLIG
jgi:hypothetical protein